MNANIRTLLECRKHLFRLLLIAVFFVMLDFLISISSPALLSDSYYLEKYLTPQALTATQEFLQNEGYLSPSDIAGWVNRPNVSRGRWEIDQYGSRSSSATRANREDDFILFLGSSTVNGGQSVRNDETVSAYLETYGEKCLNFGTMLYSLDQSLLLYEDHGRRFRHSFVVVGVDGFLDQGLGNIYIPLREREQVNMPFVKPRFMEKGGRLQKIEVDVESLLADPLASQQLQTVIQESDQYYGEFLKFKRFSLMPFSELYRRGESLLNRAVGLFRLKEEDFHLQKMVMEKFVETGKNYQAKVIFLKFVDRGSYARGTVKQFLPDRYRASQEVMKEWPFYIVDTKEVLLKSGLTPDEIFFSDGTHLRPAANKAIADYLNAFILSMEKET